MQTCSNVAKTRASTQTSLHPFLSLSFKHCYHKKQFTCQETLETTAHDSEIAIESHLHAGSKLSGKLKTLFHAFDENGDGVLTPHEWESALTVPYIQQYLQTMDVRIADCRRLFSILDDGDGTISINEFCDGLKRVKGQARAVDMVILQNVTERVMKECKAIRAELGKNPRRRRLANSRLSL